MGIIRILFLADTHLGYDFPLFTFKFRLSIIKFCEKALGDDRMEKEGPHE
jgi:hypothetical protein